MTEHNSAYLFSAHALCLEFREFERIIMPEHDGLPSDAHATAAGWLPVRHDLAQHALSVLLSAVLAVGNVHGLHRVCECQAVAQCWGGLARLDGLLQQCLGLTEARLIRMSAVW